MNDNEYYLIGGDAGSSYEDNKDLLISLFGENNCTIVYSFTGSIGYNCIKPAEWDVEVFSDGEVKVYDYHMRMSKAPFCCVEYDG